MAELDGKQLTIPQLTLYKQSTDPAMRRKAYEAEAVYFDAHRAEFDEIYDKMVKNRNEQARILGYNDFIFAGNRILYRVFRAELP